MLDRIKRLLGKARTYEVAVRDTADGGEVSWQASEQKTLLISALEAEIPLPYRCRVGSCNECKCRLLEGEVQRLGDFSQALSPREIQEGYILTCQSLPKSNLRLELVRRRR